jgi:hypothetical protein
MRTSMFGSQEIPENFSIPTLPIRPSPGTTTEPLGQHGGRVGTFQPSTGLWRRAINAEGRDL